MKYPNAYKGTLKIFIAHILEILSAILLVTTAVLLASNVSGTIITGLSIAASVSAIIAFVIQLIGLYQGGQDEDAFKKGFIATIVIILLAVTEVILKLIPGIPAFIISTIPTLSSIIALFIVIFILQAIYLLAHHLRDEEMMKKSKMLMWVELILYLVRAVLGLFPIFLGNETWAVTTLSIIAIVVALIELITFIVFVIYLTKATKMLKR